MEAEREAAMEAEAVYAPARDKCGAELDAGFEMYESAGEDEFDSD